MRIDLGIDSCVSLISLSLAVELVEGQCSISQSQWQLALAVLGNAPAPFLRRIQLCIIHGDKQHVCEDAIDQIKQLRWAALRDVAGRLTSLEGVGVVAQGTDSWIADHIWEEVEFRLRSMERNGKVLVVRRYFCML